MKKNLVKIRTNFHVIILSLVRFFTINFFIINRCCYNYLFSGTHIHGQERPKLRPNRTVTEVDRDWTETETWTE